MSSKAPITPQKLTIYHRKRQTKHQKGIQEVGSSLVIFAPPFRNNFDPSKQVESLATFPGVDH